MRRAYAEIDFAALNKILKIPGATIVGGRATSDLTLRLFIVLDQPDRPFERNPEFIDIDEAVEKAQGITICVEDKPK